MLLKTLLALTSANDILSPVANVAVVILFGFIVALVGVSDAPVHPVAVPASVSACVLISTLPAVVVSALTTLHVALVLQAPAI